MDTNATQAAIRAGYSPRSARSVGHEDLTGPDIRAAIDGAQSKQFEAAMVGDRIDIVCEQCGSGCEVRPDEAFAEEREIYGEAGAPDNIWLRDR